MRCCLDAAEAATYCCRCTVELAHVSSALLYQLTDSNLQTCTTGAVSRPKFFQGGMVAWTKALDSPSSHPKPILHPSFRL